MPYTTGQQAEIDGANIQLSNAKSALDTATADAQSKLADMNRCNCGGGKNLSGTCTPLKHQVSFPDQGNPSDCIEKPNINKCKTDCCSKSTCVSRVNTYNASLSLYNTAKINYDNAKRNLDAVLNSVSQQVKNDPTVIEATNQINANASINKTKWIFFGLIMLVIIGVGSFLGIKTDVKKTYIVGGGIGLALVTYLLFFGFGKK